MHGTLIQPTPPPIETKFLIQVDVGNESFVYFPEDERHFQKALDHLHEARPMDYAVRRQRLTLDSEGKIQTEWVDVESRGRYAIPRVCI